MTAWLRQFDAYRIVHVRRKLNKLAEQSADEDNDDGQTSIAG